MKARTWVRGGAWLFFCWLLLGCSAGLRSQAEGGLPWSEYRTTHFNLRTDAEPEAARDLARRLEDVMHVLGHVAFPYEPRFAGQTEVVLFSKERDLSLLHWELLGVHLTDTRWPRGIPTIVLAGASEQALQTVTHELVHRFVAHDFPQAPRWLHEGLAKYYETMRIEETELVVGEHPFAHKEGWMFTLLPEHLRPVTELRALDGDEFDEEKKVQANYLSSWTFVAALQRQQRRAAFRAYLDALQSGEVEETVAFREHVARFDDEVLASDRRALLSQASWEVSRFPDFRRPPAPSIAIEAFSSEDVHALFARLLARHPEEALDQARRALALDPKHPDALFVLGVVDPAASGREVVDRVFAAYENSGRAPEYGAALLRNVSTNDRAFKKRLDEVARRLTKEARSSYEYEALGRYLLQAGRASTARRYAELAARHDPSNSRAYGLLALIEAHEGNYERALHYQTWSVNLNAHGAEPAETKRLAEYRKKATASK